MSELEHFNSLRAILVFIILHVLVYPSSNGYNSYMDRDETPIGGLKNPLQPTRQLYYVTITMDLLALALSFLVSAWLVLGILLYILASRAYSYRGIRLKKYPFAGFITVFLCQGALIFWLAYHGMHPSTTLDVPLLPALISSMLIGALYPLTQVYQHEADQKDGVVTLSFLLGRKGSFVFSGMLFLAASFLLYLYYAEEERTGAFIRYLFFTLPVVLFFLYWFRKVWVNEMHADFRHSLIMNIVATFCLSAFFLTQLFFRY